MTIQEELESFFVTTQWVAEYWGCSQSSVIVAINRGLIPAHVIRTAKNGRRYNHYVIDVRDLPPRHIYPQPGGLWTGKETNGRRRRK